MVGRDIRSPGVAAVQACREAGRHWEPTLRPRLLDDGWQRRVERPTQGPIRRRTRHALDVASIVAFVLVNIGIYVFGLVVPIRSIWS